MRLLDGGDPGSVGGQGVALQSGGGTQGGVIREEDFDAPGLDTGGGKVERDGLRLGGEMHGDNDAGWLEPVERS